MTHFIYLHGFASSPQSFKAAYLKQCFQKAQYSLTIPNLNQDNFSSLTLTRQIQQVAQLFPNPEYPVTLIGSSFGGLTAAWLAQKYPQVQRLVLLAPAFDFLSHWLPRMETQRLQAWKETGYLDVYHYGEKCLLPIHYQLVLDFQQYSESNLQRPIPTLILHGRQDEVIPIQASQDYANQRPWVQLISLESNHALTNRMKEIWQAIHSFCSL